MLVFLGIFYSSLLNAIHPVRQNVNASPIYTASFSFNFNDFLPRTNIVPDRIYFNATGTAEVSAIPGVFSAAYPPWDENYTAATWVPIKTVNTNPNIYLNSLQVSQQKPGSTMTTAAGTFYVSRLTFVGNKITLDTYSSEANLLTVPFGVQQIISGAAAPKPHAMVLTGPRAYFFWFDGANKLQMRTFDGTTLSTQIQLSDGDILSNFGVSGCLINSGGEEYVAISYAKSATEVSISTFKVPLVSIDGVYPPTATTTINVGVVDSTQAPIAQNPRTGKIFLNWIFNKKAYFKTFNFSPPGSYSNETAAVEFSSDLENTYGVSIEGLENFETSFALPKESINFVENSLLRGTTISQHGLTSPAGYAVQFPYIEGGQKYLGLITLSAFTNFNFYSRLLHFPAQNAWDKNSKTLHLQGPPWPGTQIGAEVDFGEVATTTSLAHAVNTAGGRIPVNGATGIIASASTLFSVKFDRDMKLADYANLITNNKVRLLRPDNSSVPLVYVPGDSGNRDFSFRTNGIDLLFNTAYRISIASDVIDANGSQLWEAATMTFTTQANSSSVLASEVVAISAFSDAARSIPISSGGEVNATSTIYLRMQASDPAFNTIDTTTVSVWQNAVQIAVVNLTQETAASDYFYGQYNIAAPQNTNSTYEFRTPQSAISHQVKIDYPTFSPVSPASAAVNIAVGATIKIQASEDISAAEINATTVKLTLLGVAVAASRSYNPVSREITIVPDAAMESEKTYLVSVMGLKDTSGNPQTIPLSYQFSIADVIAPVISLPTSPANGETGVAINRHLIINFSEAILASSANTSTVKLLRGGLAAAYSVAVSGNQIIIDPNDAADGGLETQKTYTLEIGPSVTDLAGNSLNNAPATFTMSFTTQPTITAPTAIDSLTLYKDSMFISGWGSQERVPASATIYIKVTGTDGATQTRDVATVSLNLSWGPPSPVIILNETASNSGGFYVGSFNLDSIPLYGIPNPLPPTTIGSLSFAAVQEPADAATLTVSFPGLSAPQTTVNSVSGTVAASGASGVRIDSPLTITFTDKLLDAGNATSLSISSGAAAISGSRVLSADKTKITLTPDSNLPYSSQITINALYGASGLKSPEGNPLYRAFNFSFTTQASQTPPLSATQVNLFPDSSYSPLAAYVTNQDFPRSGTIYIEVRAPDASPNTIDYTYAVLSTGDSVKLTETAINSGIYRGLYNYPSLADGFVFTAASSATPAVKQTLQLSIPAISPVQPASSAAGISTATRVEVSASEDLDPATVNTTTVKLFKGAAEIAGAVAYRVVEKEIEFTPTTALDVSSTYLFRVTGVKDLAGNTQATVLAFSFSTQASSVAPVTINNIKVFSANTYAPASELADLAMVNKSSQIYVQISATDLAATTVDSTVLQISSNQSATINMVTLLETTINSGIFRGTATIFPEENAIISLSSQTDPSKFTRLRTYELPKLSSLQPASGTNNIYLDTIFSINTSKDIDATSISSSTIALADGLGIASYLAYLHAPREIRVISQLQQSAPVRLKISSGLKDTDNLNFSETVAVYSAMTPTVTQFRLYSNPGLTTMLSHGDKIEAGQSIYALLNGSNAFFYRTEKATATFQTPSSNGSFSMTETSPGLFTGSMVVPDNPGEILQIIPENLPAFSRTLEILPAFSLLSFAPASGATAIPADTWPTWNFSRPVRAADVNTANFRLVRTSDSAVIPGTLTISPTGRQIRFQPSNLLSLLTEYEMSVKQSVEDTVGHTLGTDIKTRFTTQPPPLPPNVLVSLQNFETSSFATPTAAVANNGTLYLQLVAADTSFSTFDTARVRVDSSDGTIDGLELTLLEISPPSGIYRFSLPVNLPAGTSIRIRSQAAPAYFIDVTAHNRTQLVSINPASGSLGLVLDTPINLTFSHAIDRSTATGGLKMLASAALPIPLNYSFADSDRTVLITPVTGYATSTRHILSISTDLRDTNGLFILPHAANFTMLSESNTSFDLLTGISPRNGQPVSQTGEAVRGQVELLATTNSLFSTYPESRTVALTTATETFLVNLNETSPGSFYGTFNFTASMPAAITGSLRFGNLPAMSFSLAAQPELLAIQPASAGSDIAELPVVTATFSSKMAYQSTNAALTINAGGASIAATTISAATDSLAVQWNLLAPLPQQSSCTLRLSGLIDYLGQAMPVYQHVFSTGGRQGINLYRDNSFAQLIATNQIEIPLAFVEVAASSTSNLTGRTFALFARTGTRATETFNLPLEAISGQSGRFRCSLELDPTRAQPQYALPMLPGEWLELSAPELTSDQKVYYYRFSGTVSPARINAIRFYAEKHYSQRVTDVIANPTLFIEAEAEDLNWLTTDITQVRVSSEADPAGFVIDLTERGTHSSQFQNFIRILPTGSDAAGRILKVLPDQLITVESVTDPSVKMSIRYLPENGIRAISAFPSPARGDRVNFRFYLNFQTDVDLEIYDTAGHEVFSTVIRGKEGENQYQWRLPRRLANGVYFFQLIIGNETPYPTAKRKARGKFAVLR